LFILVRKENAGTHLLTTLSIFGAPQNFGTALKLPNLKGLKREKRFFSKKFVTWIGHKANKRD